MHSPAPKLNQRQRGSARVLALFRHHAPLCLAGLLWGACFVLCYALLSTPVAGDNIGLVKLTESYGSLERVALWQRSLSWLPGGNADGSFDSWPRPLIVWSVRVAITFMFLVHALAFAMAARSASGRPMQWLVGPIGAQVIMLLMVPSNADVFFYAITGDIASHGMNPYTTPLYELPSHPLYQYNHWIDMASVYGPVWTMISQGVMTITGSDPASAVLGFKILFGVTSIAVAAGVYGTARLIGVHPAPATGAMVFVGWQPNIIIESAGQAHNDIVMIALVLSAVTLTIVGASKATRGGVVLATVSAAVKYVSLPTLGLLAVTRLDRRRGPHAARRIALAWGLDALAFLAVVVAVFAPYRTGDPAVLREMVSEPGRLYSNPIWHGIASAVRLVSAESASMFEETTRVVAQGAVVIAIVAIVARFALQVWRSASIGDGSAWETPRWTRSLLVGWALTFGVLAYIPVNVHAWYFTWPVVPIALVLTMDAKNNGQDAWPYPRWLAPYLVLTAILTIVYHTRVVHG